MRRAQHVGAVGRDCGGAVSAPQQPGSSPTIGDQLGLGPVWQPAPVTWRWAKVSGAAEPMHVLIMATVAGEVGVAFTAGDLQRFIDGARGVLSGLQLPSTPQILRPQG